MTSVLRRHSSHERPVSARLVFPMQVAATVPEVTHA